MRLAGCTPNPSGPWVSQQARRFAWTLSVRRRFASPSATATPRSRVTSTPSSEMRQSKIIKTPMQAPKGETRSPSASHRPSRMPRLAERTDLNKRCPRPPTRGSGAQAMGCTLAGSITSATNGVPTTQMRLSFVGATCSRSDAVPSFQRGRGRLNWEYASKEKR